MNLDLSNRFATLAMVERDRQMAAGRLEPGKCVREFRFPGWDRLGSAPVWVGQSSATNTAATCSTCPDPNVEQVVSIFHERHVDQVVFTEKADQSLAPIENIAKNADKEGAA